jgi:hypothetical protein
MRTNLELGDAIQQAELRYKFKKICFPLTVKKQQEEWKTDFTYKKYLKFMEGVFKRDPL